MSGGLVALSGMQRCIEATPGTGVAATAIQPILGGWMREMVERQFPEEQRYSFIKGYRNFALKNFVQISGMTFAPTFTDLSWWGCLFWKGLAAGSPRVATGVVSAVTAYTYTFSPTVASDDLQTATLEIGDNLQHYQVPYVIGNKIELGFANNTGLTCSVDLLGQRAVPVTKTAALAVVGDEDIIGAKGAVSIDTTTIGSTVLTTAKDYKVTWDNSMSQEFVLNGNLYPAGHHRGAARSAMTECTLLFDTNAEYTLFQNSGISIPRMTRATVLGSVIAGSTGSLTRFLTVDTYNIWDTAEYDTIDGQRAVKYAGPSQFNAGVGYDWLVNIRHAAPTVA